MAKEGIYIVTSKFKKIVYPDVFNSNKIYEHYKLREDLEGLLEKSGYKEKFKRQYRMRLKFLEDRLDRCIEKSSWFESLKSENGLYSMKIKGQLNIRVIFAFTHLENGEISVLLCGFHEKKSKDYKRAIEEAKVRLEELRSEINE